MRIRFIALLSFLLMRLAGTAQQPVEVLSKWVEKTPIEKAYLHFDRENYIAGETAWFKAYLYSNYSPDLLSTTLYVELVNESSVIIDRKIVPVFWGSASGQIEIPDSLPTGSYFIRAYSATMLNQPADFIFKRNVFIYGKNNNPDVTTAASNKVRLEFFPEGGNLVNGFVNAVAFKATNEKGLPINITGSLYNDKNMALANLSCYHDGMGMIEFTPVINEKYFVKLADNSPEKFYLPGQTDKGIVLVIETNPKELHFEIQQSTTNPSIEAAYIVGQMQHHIVFNQQLAAGKSNVKGMVNTGTLNSGIIQITVFNKDGIPLAERLAFIDNKEYIQPAEILIDTVNFSAKARNRFSVHLSDTVQGSFSVSVTDAAYDILPIRENNIISNLLLTSDLKGYVHNPSWYFKPDNDSARRAMDLVMMTNGWRRFKWTELTAVPQNKYKDLSYITLSGKVNIADSKKAFAEKDLILSISGADSTTTMQTLTTDQQGNFRIDSMFFWGKGRLLFGDTRGDKSQRIEVRMSEDSLAKQYSIPAIGVTPSYVSNLLLSAKQAKWAVDYDLIQKASGLLLEGVTVKGKRKKTPTQELEEKYTTGLFTGPSDHVLDLVNTKEKTPQRNIFEYLQSRVPAITFTTSQDGLSEDYTLYYRGGRTTSLTRPAPMILYLNEMRVDAATIATVRASDVAMVKVYSSFVGAEGNGVGGVLSIYTKKGDEVTSYMPSANYLVSYKGYSVNKEFYSPDYNVEVSEKYKTDNRVTLQWLPDVTVNFVDPKLPIVFYNSDRTNQFKIVIEGVTTKGKLIMEEKIIIAKGF